MLSENLRIRRKIDRTQLILLKIDELIIRFINLNMFNKIVAKEYYQNATEFNSVY